MAKTYRLGQVLKEFNISMERAAEFLNKNEVQLTVSPNAKLDESVYEIMAKEFHADRERRESSKEVVINKYADDFKEKREEEKRREEERLKREQDLQQKQAEQQLLKEQEEKEAQEKEAQRLLQEEKDREAARIQQEEEEKKRKEAEEVARIAAEKAEQEKAQATKEEPKDEAEDDNLIGGRKKLSGIKEVGKIELPSRSDKRKKPEPAKPQQATPAAKTEKTDPVKPAEKEPAVAAKQQATPAADTAEKKEDETIKTQYKKLDGITQVGKIDLSQFEKPKREKAIKTDANAGEKKKRKRIVKNVKLDDRKAGPQGQNRRQRPKSKDVAELTDEEVQKQIKETLEKLTTKGKGSKGAKYRREKRQSRREQEEFEIQQQEQDKTLHVSEFVTVNELATMMNVSVMDVISTCMSIGVMVTMNQRLDSQTIDLVADEFGYETEYADAEIEEAVADVQEDKDEDLIKRAPIVTVMGHVDHGKTSLLDHIREANVIAGESGGITQHIGAYSVELQNGEHITFLDTPGHEAFTAMRARGAKVTDIAIIVIAADDQVMPQTREAIAHAQAAGVPMIFAINKVDKPTANPEKVKEQLAGMNLLVEDWGGSIQSQDISAKTGMNVQELLEKVLLEAEMLDLKANPDREASGTIIEATLDKGRGYVSTIIVQNGTLAIGDYVLAGSNHGKIKAMLDERGKNMKKAGPSTPVTILGLDGAPTAGDKFRVFTDEREAKQLATKRSQLQREQSVRTQKQLTLDEIGRRIAIGDYKELNIILKGDVDGSVEALTDSLQKLSTDEIHVNILHRGVGPVTESDVLLATASEAIIIGFNVRPNATARNIADKEEVEIRTYSIIYDAINDVKEAMEGMLSPEMREEVTGNVEIRETFKITRVGTIAGCMVLDGKVYRNSKVRIIRDGVVVHEGELASLKRFKDDVKEVSKGYECGLNIKGFNDIQVGDLIEAYEVKEVKKKLK
ncbi:MAG: translation initiation factor IF-2 [Weeksellaceae bacterium]|nr:translation initiation factor IF-2 [Weeksellaceae bacterium]